jgi:hypothetical protein
VSFLCFALLDSFSAVPRASGPVFMFIAPRLVCVGYRCGRSYFHVLHTRNRFRRYRGRRVPLSCFALSDSFLAVPRASGPVFTFCTPGLVSGGTGGIGSHFLILRVQTHFRRYRTRRVPFSCFLLSDSFLAVPIASGSVFMFCAPGLVFGGAECVGFRFHVLCSQTRFRRCRVRRVPFSFFVLPDSFSAVPRALGPIFIFCASGHVFDGTEGAGSRFLVLSARTRFPRYRGRRVLFSCFVLLDSFSAVRRA